jgi:SAM-dependent methyltransferase
MATSEERSISHYTGESGDAYHSAVHGQVLQSPAVHRAKADLARYRYFRNLPAHTRIFEFGVGAGFNLSRLDVEEVAGFDVSEIARDISRSHGITIYDSMDAVPDAHFDVVVCRHVLEHVPAPVEVLVGLRQKVRDDGKLLLILPVEHGRRHQRRIDPHDVNRHLYCWRLQHAANLLAISGFEVIEWRYEWYSMQRLLRWIPRLLGAKTYHVVVMLAGMLRRQSELVIWATPQAGSSA